MLFDPTIFNFDDFFAGLLIASGLGLFLAGVFTYDAEIVGEKLNIPKIVSSLVTSGLFWKIFFWTMLLLCLVIPIGMLITTGVMDVICYSAIDVSTHIFPNILNDNTGVVAEYITYAVERRTQYLGGSFMHDYDNVPFFFAMLFFVFIPSLVILGIIFVNIFYLFKNLLRLPKRLSQINALLVTCVITGLVITHATRHIFVIP